MRQLLLIISLLALSVVSAWAMEPDPCFDCHKDTTPGVVGYWERSDHAVVDVTCADCHGSDPEASHNGKNKVEAAKCGTCHQGAFLTHQSSKHSIGLKTGGGCTRNESKMNISDTECSFCHDKNTSIPITETHCPMFLAQSEDVRALGCSTCHRVEKACDSCHTKHGTDLEVASSAKTCGVCHMGPDHAQLEMWETSPHGVAFALQGAPDGPTCTTCHMDGGSHNVSVGIATGKPEDIKLKERQAMLNICSRCHTPSLGRRNLESADRIFSQARALVAEAQEIVTELNREGLLLPKPSERPPHPLAGKQFVIGPKMIYEDISGAEAKFFRIMMFHFMSAYKGAFHQNPDYTHWYGIAPLKLALAELRSEAALLRKIETIQKRLDNMASSSLALQPQTSFSPNIATQLKQELRLLKDNFLKGELTQDAYESDKNKLLNDAGL
jgi:hydroxylamine dehydrogenase